MTSSRLYARAGQAYEQAGLPLEAARCYGAAGEYRRAADLLVGMGEYSAAVEEYRRAERPDVAAWILVHHLADPVAARSMADRYPEHSGENWTVPYVDNFPLRRSLLLARCELAEGGGPRDVLPVLTEASRTLAEPSTAYNPLVEEWAVAIAECAGRPDQVALLFAASVRGHRLGAAQRWQEWSRRVLGMELSIPLPDQQAADPPSLLEQVLATKAYTHSLDPG
ncbi:hypothetical protein [Streptomyces sp. NPDC058614]|uniref:hypothetical protein n=1 Tax=Streptomyces sp. NPDC058614 TaxID=3346557 RepID=UPI003669C8C3